MDSATPHQRWLLDVPEASADAVGDWLTGHGASATYRMADPPFTFYAYFPPGLALPDPAPLAAFPGVRLLRREAFQEEDWLAKSREGFGAIEVGRGFFIRPLWQDCPAPAGRTPIVVNPGLAFGTGGHETTRLCMGLVEDLADRGELLDPVLDIGAGTGILALAAWLRGARRVTAFDHDPDCGPAMADFMELNAALLDGQTPFAHFVGELDDPRVDGPWRTVLANILLETIQDLLPRMAPITAPGGMLVASGILAERQVEALVSLAAYGFRPLQVVQEGAWIAILAQRLP
jgi:ribosomal protein L11 methyltransferase